MQTDPLDTQAKHDDLATFFKDHGCQVATCSTNTSDYVFATAYSRALGAKDTAIAARLRQEYLAYSASEIDCYSALNRRVLGYEPPEVMLLHDRLLNADTIADILALFRSRGYSFVSLATRNAILLTLHRIGMFRSTAPCGIRLGSERKSRSP